VSADDFAASVGRLLHKVGHWEQSRWSASVAAGAGLTRADAVHGLVQQLADLAAAAEGQSHRVVPRPGDLILPDQLRVVSDDLLAAAPEDVLKVATGEVDATRRML
jgi:hypothetical protein